MHRRAYQKKLREVDALMQCMIDLWAGKQQSVINDAIDQCNRRLHIMRWSRIGDIFNKLGHCDS